MVDILFHSCFHASDIVRVPCRLPSKVRGANLPQEYELERVVRNIENPHRSWNASTSACEWNGVTCDQDMHVEDIHWSFKDLSLFEFHECSFGFEFLPQTIRSLDIGRNELSGPVQLDLLPSNLNILKIGHNKFDGGLDLTRLPCTLEHANFNKNRFEGNVDLTLLPPSLREFSSNTLSGDIVLDVLPQIMTVLVLHDNKFTGNLDLQHLPVSLEVLSCKNNCFSGLVQFDNLPPRLETLALHGNSELHGIVDYSSSSLVSIRGTKIENVSS